MTLAEFSFDDVHHVVVDIEGTTGSSAFVFDVMFPYAASRFDQWLDEHPDDPRTVEIVASIGHEINVLEPTRQQVIEALNQWVAEDRKITPLKSLQGLIWQEGFAAGELVADFFPDAVDALRAWHAAGFGLSVYSSGSVLAQQQWYAHSPVGDLTPLMSSYFDTANAGPKRDASSYRAISAALGIAPQYLLFCSDVVAELDAATEAGWQVVRVRRPGEPHAAPDSTYPEVTSMTQIHLT